MYNAVYDAMATFAKVYNLQGRPDIEMPRLDERNIARTFVRRGRGRRVSQGVRRLILVVAITGAISVLKLIR